MERLPKDRETITRITSIKNYVEQDLGSFLVDKLYP